MIALLLVGILGYLGTPAITSRTEFADALPAEWAAGDFGTLVEWDDDTTLAIYADINDGDRRFARNAIAVNDTFLIQPLVSYEDNTFYWITDITRLPDGTALVVALEVINRLDLPQDGWQFEIIDTDAFIVNDPTSQWSWTYASKRGKIDDGWWGDDMVEFSDQWPGMAFVRDSWCTLNGDCHSYVIEYNPDNVADGSRGAQMPESDGVFAPVQTENSWFGYSWDWEANTMSTWVAPSLDSPWVHAGTITYDEQTHAHGLNVIDGEIWHRWSVYGSRPEYSRLETP